MKKIIISITTGDQDGIGPEVSAKALRKIGPQKGILFYIWRDKYFKKSLLKKIDEQFERITVKSIEDIENIDSTSSKSIIDICTETLPPEWVKISSEYAMKKKIHGLCTAPLSKTLIKDAGFKEIGHTEIFKTVSSKDDLFMAFLGKYFNVLLATDHIPLFQVPKKISQQQLLKALQSAQVLKKLLPKTQQKKPIGLLGFNPHAGENGLIGNFEQKIMIPLLKKLDPQQVDFIGPLVPDAAFFKTNWKKYALYVTLYHDQGLIPFKAFHSKEGAVHYTAGLDFIRTSVDHGTAKDIAGKNKANPLSMIKALKMCVQFCRKKYGEENARSGYF